MPRSLFVTTALPYANGPLHIGHMMEYIQADIWVRFMRASGHVVHFVCADDAHGAPIMLQAEKEGISPEELVRHVALGRPECLDGFLISFDYWHSTESPENVALSQEFYRSLRDAGAVIAGGSDWSVSTFNPFVAMQHGMNRTGDTGGPFLPQEDLTLQNMVDAYTINAAYALKQDSLIGSLEPGKRADLTILDRDIFTLPPDAIAKTTVTSTWLDGRPVFSR